jgi:3-phenylpropionate/trans-cinnamate dioxygenase ferredoxin subunit
MAEEWVDLGAAQDVTEARCLSVEVDDVPLIVVRCGAEVYAVENRCTHDGRFCLKSGAALTPPAYEPLRTFNVRVEAGRILLERPS